MYFEYLWIAFNTFPQDSQAVRWDQVWIGISASAKDFDFNYSNHCILANANWWITVQVWVFWTMSLHWRWCVHQINLDGPLMLDILQVIHVWYVWHPETSPCQACDCPGLTNNTNSTDVREALGTCEVLNHVVQMCLGWCSVRPGGFGISMWV